MTTDRVFLQDIVTIEELEDKVAPGTVTVMVAGGIVAQPNTIVWETL